MSTERNIPKLRFPGFTEPWEQRKLGDLLNETREKTSVEDEDTLLSCAIDGMFLNSELFSHFRGSSNIGYLKVKKNDLILSAQNLHLGNCNVNLRFEHGIISPAYKVYELINCDPLFMQAWVKQDKTKDFFLKASTEGASVCRKNIVWEELYKQELPVPKINEQVKIGAFFQNLDNLITLHQRKLEHVKDLKKTMLQKMFPKNGQEYPELRFPGFTEPWEQRKLGDMGSTFTGLSGKTKEDFGHGDAQFITYMNVFSNPVANLEMTEAVEIDAKQNRVKKGDVFFTTSSETPEEVGMSCVMPENKDNIYLNSFCFGYRPTEKFDLDYLAYVLRADSFRKEMTFLAQGISRYNISKNKVMEVSIPIPNLEEQTMVGHYFSNLDHLITLHQRELKHLKLLKKGMLQQMFV